MAGLDGVLSAPHKLGIKTAIQSNHAGYPVAQPKVKEVTGRGQSGGAGRASEHLEDDRMAHLIRYVARGLTRSLQLRLAEHDIQFGTWIFLRILWENDGLTQRELSDRAGLMQSTTHTALAKLEAQGYVTRRHPDGDRKKRIVQLTAAGRAARTVLEPLAEAVNETALAGLDAEQIGLVRSALLGMAVNLDRDEEQALLAGQKVPPTRLPNL